ncbi:MAG: hypothetical protein PUD20_03895 [bacterium]|nr:hypothetical protein [bacterium]
MQHPIISATVSKYIDYDGNEKEELIIVLKNEPVDSCNKSYYQRRYDYYLHNSGDIMRLRIPMYQGMVRMYFSDYKNYYYLPLEDQAIHKSVAQYVDKEHRQKATPENCYTTLTVTDEWLKSEQFAAFVETVLQSFQFK